MGGFDPTAFLGDVSPPVAPAGDIVATDPAPPAVTETAEVCDVWREAEESVATVATVAMPCELLGDQPFAADLNRLFRSPECARFTGEAWRRMCLALHHFTIEHARTCLDLGWSPRELYAVGKRALLSDGGLPAASPRSLLNIGSHAAAFVVGKREVVEITSGWIQFVADRHGTLQRLRREHNPINHSPNGFALVWEVPLF